MKYNITSEVITVFFPGESPISIRKSGSEQRFSALRAAVLSGDEDKVRQVVLEFEDPAVWSNGLFKIQGEDLFYNGEPVPRGLSNRVISAWKSERPVARYLKFYERLQENPSWRSVQQLFKFMEHANIAIDEDGYIIVYKGIRLDWTDVHSGKVNNSVGSEPVMPRNRVSDDPDVPCHYGYHVGDMSYANGFGKRTVICQVDPRDVVCIPKDESYRKMRVCRYKVTGVHSSSSMALPPEVDNADLPPEVESKVVVEEDNAKDVQDTEPKIHRGGRAKRELTDEESKVLDAIGQLDSAVAMAEYSVQELRDFATHRLFIVGASKITGGKVALVNMILTHKKS